jgi:hypothetical protein
VTYPSAPPPYIMMLGATVFMINGEAPDYMEELEATADSSVSGFTV